MHYPAEPAQGSVPLPIPFVPAAVEQSSATNLGVFAVSSAWEFIKAEEWGKLSEGSLGGTSPATAAEYAGGCKG